MSRGYPDFEGAKAGLYLKPEWAAYEGKYKILEVFQVNKLFNEYESIIYGVPATKTLYLTQIAFCIRATNAADGDKNQMGGVWIVDATLEETLLYLGGNGGGGWTFPTPIIIPPGHTVEAFVVNCANHSCSVALQLYGYEI